MIPLKFTFSDADRAYEQWGCNCGPGAIAAVCGLSLEELRPQLGDFEQKRYMNPTLMWDTLSRLRVTWHRVGPRSWPRYGLARIQWEGPWTAPGVPPRAAYRYTHWADASAEVVETFGDVTTNETLERQWLVHNETTRAQCRKNYPVCQEGGRVVRDHM